jgi:hypothetical protein
MEAQRLLMAMFDWPAIDPPSYFEFLFDYRYLLICRLRLKWEIWKIRVRWLVGE